MSLSTNWQIQEGGSYIQTISCDKLKIVQAKLWAIQFPSQGMKLWLILLSVFNILEMSVITRSSKEEKLHDLT